MTEAQIKETVLKGLGTIAPEADLSTLNPNANVRETLDICETAYIVSEGHIIAEGDAETVLSNNKVREVYLGENFRL